MLPNLIPGQVISFVYSDKPKGADNMLKIREASKELGVSISWLDKMISHGLIKIIWMGGVRRIDDEELDRIKREGIKI